MSTRPSYKQFCEWVWNRNKSKVQNALREYPDLIYIIDKVVVVVFIIYFFAHFQFLIFNVTLMDQYVNSHNSNNELFL